MVTSVGMANVVWVLMLLNWLLEGRWKEKWQMARESRLLQAFAVLFLLHPLSLLWTDALGVGFHITKEMLPLLVVPLVVLTTPPPEGKTRRLILTVYGLTVFAVSVIGFVRYLTIPGLPHREIVTFISHIRFSLNICMVIYLLVIFGFRSAGSDTRHHFSFFNFLLLLWFLFFLLLLRSYTAFAILAVTSLVAIFVAPSVGKSRRWRWLAVWLAVVGLVSVMVVLGVRSYYRMVPLSQEPLKEYTAGGRPYEHRQDGFIENGNYVNNYICRAELLSEWPKRSSVPLDSPTSSDYSVESALIRYLNALGLTKDSAGIAALTDSQVDEIGRGVANPVYEHGSPFKKMLYVALFEYENYRCYKAVRGFTMLQRLELWQCARRVIAKHPWIGTGVGDLHDDMHTEFVAMNSPMLEHEVFPHNEYLTLISMFGFLGFAVIVFFFLRAWYHPRTSSHSLIKILWLVTILISFLTENTLDSLAGILFCTWFLAFFSRSAHRS